MNRPEYPDGCRAAVAKDEAAHAKVEARGELREKIQLALETIELWTNLDLDNSQREELEQALCVIRQESQQAQELFAEYLRGEE